MRAHIIEHYKRFYSSIDVSPLVRSNERIDIDELYTPLIILDEKDSENPINELIDKYHLEGRKLFERYLRFDKRAFFNSGKLMRNVFLTGEAGFGKTTFCKKLLSVWCQKDKIKESSQDFQMISAGSVWDLNLFKFVFYVCLRDTNTESSLEEMVKKQLLPPKCHDTFDDILEHEPEKCLFICDGLDEWNPPEDMPKDPTTTPGLPLRNSKSNYVTLFTARSWKLDNIRPTPGEVDAVLKIKAIVDQRELIGKLLQLLDKTSGKQATIVRFIQEMRNRENVNLLMKTPLVLKLIVCLWYDKQMLNESLTCVYSDIIELFLRHAADRNNRDNDFRDDSCHIYTCKSDMCSFISDGRPHIQKYSYLLLKLSKLAFETLFSKNKLTKLIFRSSDLSSFGIIDSELNILLKLGILSLHMVASTTVLEEEKEVAFIHKSFQEYFAACYLTTRDDIKIETILEQKCITIHDFKSLETFLVFVSCMSPSTMHRISVFMASFVNNDISCMRQRQSLLPVSSYYSADEIYNVLFSCLREAKSGHDTDVKIIVSDIFCPPVESELLRNIDFKETKSLTVKTKVMDSILSYFDMFEQLETFRDLTVELPIEATLQIMKLSQESLKFVFLKKKSLSNQYLAECCTLIQNMPQLKYAALENVIYFKSMMETDHFLKECIEDKCYQQFCFRAVKCLPHLTKWKEEEHCSIVIKVADQVTMEGSHRSIFWPKDHTHFTSLKNEIPFQWLSDFVSFLGKLELVDVKMPFLSLKSLFEEVRFRNNCKDKHTVHELKSFDIYKRDTAYCTVQLTLGVCEKKIHQLSVSDLEQQDDPVHLLTFLRTDFKIGNFKCSSHCSHLFMHQTYFTCTIDCMNLNQPSVISLISWAIGLPHTKIRMTTEYLYLMKHLNILSSSYVYEASITFCNISHSFIRKVKPHILQNCNISEFHLEHVYLEDSSLDFDLSKVTYFSLNSVTLTFEAFTGILKGLEDWICKPNKNVCFSKIFVGGKGNVDSYWKNCPEISVEKLKLSGNVYIRRKIIVFKHVSNEDISKVRQVFQLLNDLKEILCLSYFTCIIRMKNVKFTRENFNGLISSVNIFCNEPVIDFNRVAILGTNGEESENVVETRSQNWLPQIHVIDEHGMLSLFKEFCNVHTLVCMTEENDNVRLLMRLLPTCQCLEELRLLDININNMTFDFSSQMKSLRRIYLSRSKATSESLQTLLEGIPTSEHHVNVYLNNMLLLDKTPKRFLDSVQNMKEVHVDAFSNVKQVFPDHSFFFDDTEDDSQFFRMTVRKKAYPDNMAVITKKIVQLKL